MHERWRQPIEVIEVNPHPLEIIQMPDGRLLRGAEIILAKEGLERLRAGQACINCFEPQETAWPERCSLCGYPMKAEQARVFAEELGGGTHIGSRLDLDEERARLRGEL